MQMMQSMQQSMKAMNDVTTAVMMPLPNQVESVTAVELSVETIAEDEATLHLGAGINDSPKSSISTCWLQIRYGPPLLITTWFVPDQLSNALPTHLQHM